MPLTTPTLAIADNAAVPTGCVATITGSDPASTNTVSWQAVTQALTQAPSGWTAGGSRTGDGTLNISLPAGIYCFKCDSVLSAQSAVSNLIFLQGLTDGLAAVHERCLLAVEAGLRVLITAGSIPLISSVARVYDQVEMNLQGMDLPGIAVCTQLPAGTAAEQFLAGTNLRDDVGYPVYVIFVDRASGEYVTPRPSYLKAREKIGRYFRQQHLASSVAEVYIVRQETGPILKYDRSDYQLVGSVIVLRCVSREQRGA
jgi:hypothetical protein